ncbi:hypothetical protein LUZ60_015410 [Juncus effusus]|nr:hypothetical protein LUZ60_015410 [Juncus effusus]
MSIEEELESNFITTNLQQNQVFLEWLEHDSISILPTFLEELTNYNWWEHDESFDPPQPTSPMATLSPKPIVAVAIASPPPLKQPEFSKKRKANRNPANTCRKACSVKRSSGKSYSRHSENEARWAEQLLNPCALAIETGNMSRAQHLLYVLQELASSSGDINHRLAYHGLRTLIHQLNSNGGFTMGVKLPPYDSSVHTYASTEAKLFRSTLIRFHEISPWFSLPNSLANSSIVKSLNLDRNASTRALHIIDLGVSHGVQWPTLLEALTHLPNGAPPLVQLTIVSSVLPQVPFCLPPPGYNFPSHLLRYAKSINLNLLINQVEKLTPQDLTLTPNEKLVVCAQFRVGKHKEILRSIRDLNPDLVVLSELDGSDDFASSSDFPGKFAMNLEMLWRFLDSTGAAFKWRECAERKVMEGEAGRMLDDVENEGREKWREKMVNLGFRELGFGDDTMDVAKTLLRKYDNNWEMKVDSMAMVGLRWKGRPVSFCSLWKPINER